MKLSPLVSMSACPLCGLLVMSTLLLSAVITVASVESVENKFLTELAVGERQVLSCAGGDTSSSVEWEVCNSTRSTGGGEGSVPPASAPSDCLKLERLPAGASVTSGGGGISDRYEVSADGSLIIKKYAPALDSKVFRCTLNATSSLTYHVYMLPYVKKFPKSKNVVEGESLELVCHTQGAPRVTVEWSVTRDEDDAKALQITNGTQGEFNVQLRNGSGGEAVNNVLYFPELADDQRGHYQCMAVVVINGTSYNATSTVLIRVKDKLAALWPFLGIVAEVIVLCLIIFIYEKKRSKDAADDDDDASVKEEMNKNAANVDHNRDTAEADDLRQRK